MTSTSFFLIFFSLHFFDKQIIEVQPLNKRGHPQPMVESKKYRKVPVAEIVDKGIIVDSSNILDAIADQAQSEGGEIARAASAFFSPEARKWASWSDDKLAVLLFPNITRNMSESWNAFSYVVSLNILI